MSSFDSFVFDSDWFLKRFQNWNLSKMIQLGQIKIYV